DQGSQGLSGGPALVQSAGTYQGLFAQNRNIGVQPLRSLDTGQGGLYQGFRGNFPGLDFPGGFGYSCHWKCLERGTREYSQSKRGLGGIGRPGSTAGPSEPHPRGPNQRGLSPCSTIS